MQRRPELAGHHYRKQKRWIFERDGWMCWLCGNPVDPNLKYPHAMSGQVDHVIGRETGGDPKYLRTAHKTCNEKRGKPGLINDPAPTGGTKW